MSEVLHYLGYDIDHGGIVSVVRNLAVAGEFDVVLGMNREGVQKRFPALPQEDFTSLTGEVLSPQTFWRARQVAREVKIWLAADASRVFHGHSRAGLVVGAWLHQWGERRVVVSVHCYGRRRWFYRLKARQLGRRMWWLSPAMKRYYEVGGDEPWAQCLPGGVARAGQVAASSTDNVFRLVGIGECVSRKRWDLVLDAMGQLPSEFCFEHIGGGPERETLQARTIEYGLAGRVTWEGREPDSRRVLATADALVVASEDEPFAMAMLEAQAAGVPVIAADSGGAADLVEPGRNGELFQTGDATDLARAVQRWHERGTTLASPPEDWPFYAANVARRWREVYASLGED
jgi:glycosyltransferase involved in cell wall biosynthesis